MQTKAIVKRIYQLSPLVYEQMSELWNLTGVGNPARGDTFEVVEETLKGGACILMAYLDDIAVGTLWLTHDFRRAYIHHTAVLPKLQNRRIGRALMREALIIAGELGYQAKLEVSLDNPGALKIYRECGFQGLDGYLIMIKRDVR